MIKKVGCCSMCGKEVFDIVQRFPHDSPLKGRPMRVGKPHSDAVRKQLLLSDGTRMDLTFCKQCTCEPEDLPQLWKNVMETFVEEMSDDYRRAVGAHPYVGQSRERVEAFIQHMAETIPLGVMFEDEWENLSG